MRRRTLTLSQAKTHSFLKQYIAKNGQAPTMVELREAFELRSLRSVTQRLEMLEKKGLIKRNPFQHRSIQMLEKTHAPSGFIEVPVIASAGCDAMEVYAQDEFGEYILIEKSMLRAHTNIAAIRAVGDSMQDAGIRNGDYVIVEVTEHAENGDRVVAVIGNMAVIKRYTRAGDVVVLNPENKDGGYHPIIVNQEDSKIFGKVLSVIPGGEWIDDIKIEYSQGYEPRK